MVKKKKVKLKSIITVSIYITIMVLIIFVFMNSQSTKELNWEQYNTIAESGNIAKLEKYANHCNQVSGYVYKFIDRDIISIRNDKYPKLEILSYLSVDDISTLNIRDNVTIKGTISLSKVDGSYTLCITDRYVIFKPQLVK